ncbi:MAG: glutaredoxin family protein [Anaerolineae bacterium]|nr:glutaredoxin family protein [Anaerolineae bacterium]MDW8099437.1 glutaredoxin family protein [Anaerolineae bacterium]
MIQVTLYGTADCPLCDEALEALEELAAEYGFGIQKVDITRDEQLYVRFHEVIPVIDVEGTLLLAPIDSRELRQVIEAALGWI